MGLPKIGVSQRAYGQLTYIGLPNFMFLVAYKRFRPIQVNNVMCKL